VRLEPHTSVRIEPADADGDEAGYRLYLERGTLVASVFAAPRLFQVGTPAGIAVDLGCAYEATVASDGSTRLAVTSGRVSFETRARRVLVPAGAETRAEPGAPPATPVWSDADAAWRAAVRALDLSRGGDAEARAAVLATRAPRDGLTLVHLFHWDDAALRVEAFERLATLVPPPDGVERAACLRGERDALERWRRACERAW
jgi:hypothetical protein